MCIVLLLGKIHVPWTLNDKELTSAGVDLGKNPLPPPVYKIINVLLLVSIRGLSHFILDYLIESHKPRGFGPICRRFLTPLESESFSFSQLCAQQLCL